MTAAPHAPARGVPQSPAPACAWCGAPATAVGDRLAVCRRCGTATTFPAPDEAELEAAYGGWYRPAQGRFAGGADRLLRRSRGALARRLDAAAPPGPVLDVGAGDGALLDALAARGREAVGLERAAAHPRVRAQEITAFSEREGEWAAIVFWHSLEHLRDPAQAVSRAVALLAPGGLLVIAVPNWTSWQSRALARRWLARDLPRHLVHLPARALLEGLTRHGLTVERVSFWRGGQVVFGWLHGLVALLPGRLDLYDALRQPPARQRPVSSARRALTLAAGASLSPLAGALSALEVAARAGGTVYVEARRR